MSNARRPPTIPNANRNSRPLCGRSRRKFGASIELLSSVECGSSSCRPGRLNGFEAEGDYVKLHVGKDSHLLRETMTAMARRLDGDCFARINRSVDEGRGQSLGWRNIVFAFIRPVVPLVN